MKTALHILQWWFLLDCAAVWLFAKAAQAHRQRMGER